MEIYEPEKIFVEQGAEALPLTEGILSRLSGRPVEVLEDLTPVIRALSEEPDPISTGKRWLMISRYPGGFLKKCPGTQGFVCCNYTVLNAVTGCPLDCSYCILQKYLYNNSALRVFANTQNIFSELEAVFAGSMNRFFRVGTGELTDSLALDPLTAFSRELVPFFGRQKNALLELKTKTNHVENLLDLPHRGRTVVAWSVNPEFLIASDEKGCASLDERLSAAAQCHNAGYRIAFHFDPIFFEDGWEVHYSEVVKQLFQSVPSESIAWISLGGLRFPPEVKPMLRKRFPESRLVTGEMVPCPDNKLRFLRPVRVPGYRKMVEWIRHEGPKVPVYLCMESRDVWKAVFEKTPSGMESLSGIF